MLSENRLYQIKTLCTRPVLCGLAATTLWFFVLRPLGIHAHPDDKTMGENFQFYTTFHAIIAALFFQKIWSDREKLRICVEENDEKTFRRLRFDTLPFAHAFFLAVLTFYIISAALYKHYEGVVEGLNGTFSNTFIMMLFWEMARHLDNPVKAAWNKRIKIPEAWLLPKPGDNGC